MMDEADKIANQRSMRKNTNLILKDLEERIKNKNIIFDITGETKKGMSETGKALYAEMNRNIQLQEEIERLKEPKKKNPCRECGEEMDGGYFFQERQHKTCQKCNAKYGRNARKPKEEKKKHD